ncbi:MAG TPA: 2'-5' RNA ligase family protein, partial [Thermoanaerobaculia bacterium]|nr:2'-5' RNA ligase family protein [Thermoanaerobaculia bacterium]
MTEPETLRAFLAVPAPPAWVESARDLVAGLRGEMPDASWTRPESWHITLHFLGGVLRAQADRFAAEVAPIVEAATGGDLETSGAVVFPPRGPARVLAAGFADGDAAASLARIADAATRIAGETR